MGSTVTGDVSVTGVVMGMIKLGRKGSGLLHASSAATSHQIENSNSYDQMGKKGVLACHMHQVLQQAIKLKILVPPNKREECTHIYV